MTTRPTFLTLVVAFAAAAPLHGQAAHAGHAASPGTGQDMMMCGGMEHGAGMQHGQMQHGAAGQHAGAGNHDTMVGYAGNPSMILHHAAELGLSASQVDRIRTLQQAGQADCMQHMKLAQEQHMAANAALSAPTPNLATFEAKLKEAAQHMVQAHVALARRGVEALNLLTQEQRTGLLAKKHDAATHKH